MTRDTFAQLPCFYSYKARAHKADHAYPGPRVHPNCALRVLCGSCTEPEHMGQPRIRHNNTHTHRNTHTILDTNNVVLPTTNVMTHASHSLAHLLHEKEFSSRTNSERMLACMRVVALGKHSSSSTLFGMLFLDYTRVSPMTQMSGHTHRRAHKRGAICSAGSYTAVFTAPDQLPASSSPASAWIYDA